MPTALAFGESIVDAAKKAQFRQSHLFFEELTLSLVLVTMRYSCFGANIFFLAVLTLGSFCYADEPTFPRIVFPHMASTDINHEDYYFHALLLMALEKTEAEYGGVQLLQHDQYLFDNRLRRELQKANLDVIWSVVPANFNCDLLPIPVSLLGDLNDYRLLLIRQNDQARFDAIDSLDGLRTLEGGMGQQWSDTDILRANGLSIVTAPGYGKLFYMLAAGRFDYFARGIFQIYSEVNMYPALHLQIENNLMLHYRNPFYFFVRTNEVDLARRLQLGLQRAQADGSFRSLLESIPRHKLALAELKGSTRKVLELDEAAAFIPDDQARQCADRYGVP